MKWIGASLVALMLGSPSGAFAQPSSQVQFVVGFPAGVPTVLAATAIGTHLAAAIGQQVVVVARPGLRGTRAANDVAKSSVDGTTLLYGSVYSHVIEVVLGTTSYDPVRDFSPIAMVAIEPLVLVVHPSLQARAPAEFVALAKSQQLSVGISAEHSFGDYLLRLLGASLNTNLTPVVYKGSLPLITGMTDGQVQAAFSGLAPVLPHVSAGRLRPIAVTGFLRSPRLSDVPTFAEANISGLATGNWHGIFGPAGMSQSMIDFYFQRISATLDRADVRETYDRLGMLIPPIRDPKMLGAYLTAEIERWRSIK